MMSIPTGSDRREQMAQSSRMDDDGLWTGPERSYLDLQRLRGALSRQSRLIAAPVILTLAGAIAYLLMTPSEYTATTQILIDSPKPKIMRGEAVLSGLDTNRLTLGPVIDSEVEILQSAPLAERVIRTAKLHDDPTFASRPSLISRLIRTVKQAILGAPEVLPQSDVPPVMIEHLLSRLDVKRKGLSLVLLVRYTDESPARAALIANQVAAEYLNEQRESKSEIIKQANGRLRQQVEQLRVQVVASERQLRQYREEHNLTMIGGMTAGDRELADTVQQLTAARSELSARLAELQEAERMSSDANTVTSMSRVMHSEVVTNLRRLEAEVMRKIATLTSQFGAQHQQVEHAQAELRNLRREIDAEVARLVQNVRNDYAIALSRVKHNEEKLKQLKEEAAKRDSLGIKLAELERQAKAATDLYFSLLTRLEETQAQESMLYADARIMAKAMPPNTPSAPKKSMILGISLLASLGLGIALALLRDHFSGFMHTVDDVEHAIGPRPIASLPRLGGRRADHIREVMRNRSSPYTQNIFTLRRWLLSDTPRRPGGVVAVASALGGAGKTVTAANLALYATRVGLKPLLIDCNLSSPELTKSIAPDAELSILDVLSGSASLDEVISEDADSGLRVCPGTSLVDPLQAMELLSSGKAGALFRQAAQDHDLVLIDTSALLSHAETGILLEYVDAVILVIEAGRTGAEDVAKAYRMAPTLATKPVSLVLNKTREEKQRGTDRRRDNERMGDARRTQGMAPATRSQEKPRENAPVA